MEHMDVAINDWLIDMMFAVRHFQLYHGDGLSVSISTNKYDQIARGQNKYFDGYKSFLYIYMLVNLQDRKF